MELCVECGEEKSKKYMKFHLAFVHKIGTAGVSCDICGDLFLTAKRLKTHLSKKHDYVLENQKIPCKHCGELFESSYKISQHKKKYMDEDSADFHQCQL